MYPFECISFFVFSSAFSADFQLEEQYFQLLKVPFHVLHSRSLLEVVERVYHPRRPITSFVCDSLITLAGFVS
jgi:hypothetical protein